MAPRPRPIFDCSCGDHSWTAATKGYVVMVSPEDRHIISARAWSAALRTKIVYAQARVGNKVIYMHGIIARPTPGQETDHRNRWGMDNRRRNLRNCTRTQNAANTTARRGRFKGVWKASRNRWQATLRIGDRCLYLGIHETEEAAARAYDAAALEHHGEFASLNLRGTT